jgi:chromosomal replication initiator protein
MFDSGNLAATPSIDTATGADIAETLKTQFDSIKTVLKREAGDTAFRTWIAPVDARAFDRGVLEITAPTRLVRDWVKTHYADRIQRLWAQISGTCHRVDVVIAEKTADAPRVTEAFEHIPVANENSAVVDISSPLDPRFSFDTFVTGSSNELALAACKRVAAGDAVSFNPLYIQGSVGQGKTHLMQATAAAIRAGNPARRCVYMSAEKFMFQFVRALRARDTMTFKEQFRAVDVLFIDDLQFICGKEQTQQEFLSTFNALIAEGKQVVLAADTAPGDLQGIDDRLKSRLGMGLVAAITPADESLRRAVLEKKCSLMNRDVPADVIDFLSVKITASLREVEGALNRLIAHSDLIGRPVTRDSAESILQDLLRHAARKLTIEDIQKKVAEHYNIRVSDILSPRRARPLARPRQVAMYLSKILTEHSLPEIGRKFAGRDHTTIIHGVRKVEELMASDAAIARDVDTLKRQLASA